jgi:hypothetical protein
MFGPYTETENTMSKSIRREPSDDHVAARVTRRTAALAEARRYYELCARAAAAGIPTSLDDPESPRTVAGLRSATLLAEAV